MDEQKTDPTTTPEAQAAAQEAADKAAQAAAEAESDEEDTESEDEVTTPDPGDSAITSTNAPGQVPAGLNRMAGCPNKPSFDYDPKTKEPNLLAGELVEVDKRVHGIRLVATNQGRVIYCCTIGQYEKRIAPLSSRELFAQYFPHAAKGLK